MRTLITTEQYEQVCAVVDRAQGEPAIRPGLFADRILEIVGLGYISGGGKR